MVFIPSGCGIKSGINTTFLARNCGSVSVAPELTMPPRRKVLASTNTCPMQGQRTLTEVDGVVEIGPDTLRPYTAASSRGWPMGRACLTLLEFHLDDSELLRRVESGVGLTHETCHARYWTHEACPTPALLRAPLDRMTRLAARCHRSVQRAAGEKPLDSRLRAGSRTACSVCVLRHNAARSRLPGRKCVHGDRPWHSISTTVTRGVCI